jgi:lipopolysaccharide transport system permease protein
MKYNIGYLFDLLVVITNKDLKVRYKSSVFGYCGQLQTRCYLQ